MVSGISKSLNFYGASEKRTLKLKSNIFINQ